MDVDMKVYVIGTGRMYNDYNLSQAHWTLGTRENPKPEITWYKGPSYAVLIEHPTAGYILFDMGSNPRSTEIWPKSVTDTCYHIPVEGETMEEGLASIGLEPKDINYVVMSHMHMDHIGNTQLFKDTAEFFVGRKEAEYAFSLVLADPNPDTHGFYNKDDVIATRKKVTYIDEDRELFPGIDVINLPGHTPGLIGLILHMKGKNIMLVSDALNAQANYDGRLPGVVRDPISYVQSREKIKKLEKENDAWVWYGHDIEQFNGLKKIPEYYE